MKQLDQELKDWSESKRADQDHLTKLANSIHKNVVEARMDVLADEYPGNILGLKVAYAGLGAAVASIIFLLVGVVSNGPSPEPGTPSPQYATISAKDVQTSSTLFAEMEKMFSERLKWVAESNGDVGLGIESVPDAELSGSVPMLVRLVVVAQDQTTDESRTVWQADVLVRGEEFVEISPNRGADNKLGLWVYPLEDGKIALDTSLSLDAPVRLESRANRIASRGKPEEIMCLHTDGIEYRVFQTVEILSERSEA